jgi:hypothetical protein
LGLRGASNNRTGEPAETLARQRSYSPSTVVVTSLFAPPPQASKSSEGTAGSNDDHRRMQHRRERGHLMSEPTKQDQQSDNLEDY